MQTSQPDEIGPNFGGLYRSLALTAGLPLVTVLVLEHRFHQAAVEAFGIAAVFPLADIGLAWRRTRRLEPFGALMLALLLLGVGASLVSGDVRFALVKESLVTGAVGTALLISLAAPRPLIFVFGRQFATRGDPAQMARWDRRWAESAGVRRTFRLMTTVWGCAFLTDAVLRAVLVYTLPPDVTTVVSPLTAIAVILGLVAWTVALARRAPERAATA